MKQSSKVLSIVLALLMIFSVTVSAAGGGGSNPLTVSSAKVGETDLEGASIKGDDIIVLTFSNNVTDDSVWANNVSKITVKDSTGAAVNTVSPSKNGNNAISVSLGAIKKGAFTLTISAGLKAKNGSELSADASYSFTVTQKGTDSSGSDTPGQNPLNIESVKVNDAALEGATLKGTETIVILCSRGMHEYQEANKQQITVTKKDDNSNANITILPVEDEVDPETGKHTDANKYIRVQLNGLADGEYELKIGKDLKANNEQTLGTAMKVNFTVKTAAAQEPDNGGNSDAGDDKANFVRNILDTVLNFFKTIFNYLKDLFKK